MNLTKLALVAVVSLTICACSKNSENVDSAIQTEPTQATSIDESLDKVAEDKAKEAVTCQKDGGQVAQGTTWCRQDQFIHKCNSSGKWTKTGTSCTP